MNTRREELQRLSVKNGLKPIAKFLGIKNISKMNKNFLIDSILDFERTPFQYRCKPYVCKGINLIEIDDFITCSECFSFSIKN